MMLLRGAIIAIAGIIVGYLMIKFGETLRVIELGLSIAQLGVHALEAVLAFALGCWYGASEERKAMER